MARYIDADALIAEYDRVHVGAPGGARKLMVDAPTADVVPSERYNRAMDGLKAVLEERAEDKVEVAREIFEELERMMLDGAIGGKYPAKVINPYKYAELKKKYTGEPQ